MASISSGPARPPARADIIAGLIVFAIGIALYLIWPLLTLRVQAPVSPNEGWEGLLADRAFGAGALYPPRDEFVFNNYPPLSFYLVGGLGRLIGDNIIAGRVLSLLSVFAIAGNVALIARNLKADAWSALFAGVLLAGIMCKSFTTRYVGIDDPQLLAHAVMSAGFAVWTAAPARTRNLVLSSLLMVLAGLIKHSIIAMPLAVTVWLLFNNRASAWRWIAVSVLFVAAAIFACWLAYGAAFFEQVSAARTYDLYRILTILGWLQSFILPLLIWLVFALRTRPDPVIRLVEMLLIAATFSFLLTRASEGVSVNALFDLVIASCIALGVALSRFGEISGIERFGVRRAQRWIIALLCLRLVILPQSEFMELVSGSGSAPRFFTTIAPNYQTALGIMRQAQGPALCEDLALCYWSGHQSAYFSYNATIAFLSGTHDVNTLRQQIAGGRYRLIELDGNSPLLAAARASGMTQTTAPGGEIIFTR